MSQFVGGDFSAPEFSSADFLVGIEAPEDLGADLAPQNASDLERELARLSGYLDRIDETIIGTIWDAWRAPAPILPWLAWAMSVDVWDDAWPDVTKRRAIADSPEYHRRKGTRRAVEMMVELSGLPWEMTEWFDAVPAGRRGTAVIHVNASLAGAATVLAAIKPLVMAAKPKSRAIFFGAGDVILGEIVATSGMAAEELVTVDPFAFEAQNPEGAFVVSYGALVEETTTVEAR